MCSTGSRAAAGSTTCTFVGWTRAKSPQGTVPEWGKSPSAISMRLRLFHGNQQIHRSILLVLLQARLRGGFYPNNYLERNRCGGPVIKRRCKWMENKRQERPTRN